MKKESDIRVIVCSLLLVLSIPICMLSCSRKETEKQQTREEAGSSRVGGTRAERLSQPRDGWEAPVALEPPELYNYVSRSRRDPFESVLETDDYQERTGLSLLMDVVHLEGIIRAATTRIALVSNEKGRGFVLKEGQSLIDGKVLKIREDSITFLIYGYGASRTMTVKMESEEEG